MCHFTLNNLYKYKWPLTSFGMFDHTFFLLLSLACSILGILLSHTCGSRQANFKSWITRMKLQSWLQFDQRWPTPSGHHLTSIFWGYFYLSRPQLLAQKPRFSKHFNRRPNCRLTANFKTTVWMSLNVDFVPVLGWIWPPDQAEFDWGRLSCFEDILLLLWPTLTF